MFDRKGLPIGIDNFKAVIDNNYCFADKTQMICELIDNIGKVNLFTRPRRFGKTLALSMIQYYFEKSAYDNSHLFDGLEISRADERYKAHQGQYPVISLSLKSMKQPNFEYAFSEYKAQIVQEYGRHPEILDSDAVLPTDKKIFRAILNDEAPDKLYISAIRTLSNCLTRVCNKKVIILIDEYNVPLENSFFRGFYDEMADLIRSVFESALKTNNSLAFAVLTGCLRISKESIFTGLNNLNVYPITDDAFSRYFGFTEHEVESLVKYYELDDCLDEIKLWYDGYKFGESEIYNPWSVLNYVRYALNNKNHIPEAYWVNTSSNDIIRELIVKSDKNIRNDIEMLISDDAIDKPLYQDITYANMNVR